jgi:hypothetical protein
MGFNTETCCGQLMEHQPGSWEGEVNEDGDGAFSFSYAECHDCGSLRNIEPYLQFESGKIQLGRRQS